MLSTAAGYQHGRRNAISVAPYLPSERPRTTKSANRWGLFVVILGVLSLVGSFVAYTAMFALAMAPDPCYDPDSPFRVCKLTARGQNVLALIPWMVLIGAGASAVASAVLMARRGKSPLWGLWFWGAGGALVAVAANEIAYLV